MPPPPPNFLPAAVRRNRRPLDPTRHLQSRELWNKVRFHASATANNDDSNNNKSASSSWLYYTALIQAILYEIQPFRIKPCYHRLIIFLREEDGLRRVLTTSVNKTIHVLGSIQKLCRLIYNLLRQYGNMQSIQQNKHTIGKATLTLIGLKLYHRTLLYLHELLHAGPILIILTLFTLLYTIGLGDNTGANSGVPSAYSVFNRGMRRILGTVDAEDLARQYAGGAAAAAMGGGNDNVHRRDGGGGGIWVPHHDEDDSNGEDEDDENRLRNERRRQRRLERLQRRNNQENDANDDNNNDDNVNEQVNNDVDDDLDDDIQNDSSTQADENASETNTGGARKTGKKARRRNLELRREMQRQRQAAAANGFGRGNGDDEGAMDRLVGEVAD